MSIRFVILTLITCIGCICSTYAQKASIGARLQLLLRENIPKSPIIKEENGQPFISLLLETNSTVKEADFFKTGIQIRSLFGSIATVNMPFYRIEPFALLPFIKRIELPLLLQKLDTTTKCMTMVDKVHAGLSPLAKSYFGGNVLIGIIDDGIDGPHDGKTLVEKDRIPCPSQG